MKRELGLEAVCLEVGRFFWAFRGKADGLARQRSLADATTLLELDNGSVGNDLGKDGCLDQGEGRQVPKPPVLIAGRDGVVGKGRRLVAVLRLSCSLVLVGIRRIRVAITV